MSFFTMVLSWPHPDVEMRFDDVSEWKGNLKIMAKWLVFLLVFLNSCRDPQKGARKSCSYTLEHLLKEFDKGRFEISRSLRPGAVDFVEKPNNTGIRSIYKFDDKHRLRFYAVLDEDSNKYEYSRVYDTAGQVVQKTGGDVARWFAHRRGTDSVQIEFLLSTINFRYGKMKLNIVGKTVQYLPVYRSMKHSNMYFVRLTVSDPVNSPGYTLILTGVKVDRCSGDTSFIADTSYFKYR